MSLPTEIIPRKLLSRAAQEQNGIAAYDDKRQNTYQSADTSLYAYDFTLLYITCTQWTMSYKRVYVSCIYPDRRTS